MTKALLFILGFYCTVGMAGYRVYKLQLTSKNTASKKTKNQIVLSTLDPQQYSSYHQGTEPVRVRLLDTWFCPGDTSGFRKYCDKPKRAHRGTTRKPIAKRK